MFSLTCYGLCLQKSVVSVLEALAAVDGTIVVRLEGNLALLAAVGAGSVEHLAGGSLAALSLAGVAAITASLGLVGEALLGVELLLAGGENEFASAILADNGLVSVHCIPLLFLCFLAHDGNIIQPFVNFVKSFFEINVNYFAFFFAVCPNSSSYYGIRRIFLPM